LLGNDYPGRPYLLFCDKIPVIHDMHAQMPILRDIIYGAVSRGADLNEICQALAIDPKHLTESDRLVPFKPAAEVWDVTLHHTQDPLLGLHLGEEIGLGILGILGYLMQSCHTLHEAIVMLLKYNSLHSTMLKYELGESGTRMVIRYEPAILWQHQYPESVRQSIELAMSAMVKIFSVLSGKKIFPVRVELAYPARALPEYERIFQSVIEFNAGRNGLIFRQDDLMTAILSHDKSLFAFFSDTLAQKLQSLEGHKEFSARIKHMVITDFKGRVPSIEIAASHLNMTPRSIQRKLKEEQTSYRHIATTFKKELAESILNTEQFRVGEVAAILGYSDSSAFRKAQKKWS
jgi:AraC-like DNA-binding protein